MKCMFREELVMKLPLIYLDGSLCSDKKPKLGTRQHCRDNVTMFSGHKVVGYCIMYVCIRGGI